MTTAFSLATLVPASSIYATSSTTATYSINLLGGAGGSLHYQSALNSSALLPIGPNGAILQSNGSTPYWTAYTGTSQIIGGGANQVVYQTAPNTTGFLATPTIAGTVLTWNGTALAWGNPGVASAVAGGLAYQILYQTAPGATGYIAQPSTPNTVLTWNGSTFTWGVGGGGGSSQNIYGGGTNTIPYQVANSSTSFIPGPTTASTFLMWSATGFTYTNNTYVPTFGVGVDASGVTGQIRATNSITSFYSSDKKFKENIQDIPDALEIVKQIGGKLYDWTDEYIAENGGEDGYFIQRHDFGVIAQDVQRVFPRAVRKRAADGSLAVDYEKLCALAFAAIKELSDKLDNITRDQQ